jgi:hypothetical protein
MVGEGRKKPGVAFWATTVVVVGVTAIAAYGGAYLWAVEPTVAGGVLADSAPPPLHAEYPRFGNSPLWEDFFAPAHWADKCIRPQFWEDE